MKQVISVLLLQLSTAAYDKKSFSGNEFSIHGFHNPPIGLEYRHKQVSVYDANYSIAFKNSVTTKFLNAGATAWFPAVGK